MASLEGHVDGIYALAKSPKRLDVAASGSGDGEIRLWDLNRQHMFYSYPKAHSGIIQSLCMSPLSFTGGVSANESATTGHRMLSCSVDRTIKVWDADPVPSGVGQYVEYDEDDDEVSGVHDTMLLGVREPEVMPGEPLAVYSGRSAFNALTHHAHAPRFASASDVVQVWDLSRAGGDALRTISWGPDSINALRFNQSEPELLVGAGSDRSIVLYDLRTSKPLTKAILNVRAC